MNAQSPSRGRHRGERVRSGQPRIRGRHAARWWQAPAAGLGELSRRIKTYTGHPTVIREDSPWCAEMLPLMSAKTIYKETPR